jgi:hypothetical protein
VTKILTLDLEGVADDQIDLAKEEAGNIIVNAIQDALDASSSPVEGGEFKPRKKDGSNSTLLDFGDLRDAIEFKSLPGDQIEVGVFRGRETPKAFGHNTDFRGHPTLDGKGNKRQFIPAGNEDFDSNIMGQVEEAIQGLRELNEDGPTTLADLLDTMESEESTTGPSFSISLASLLEDIDGEG